MVERAVIATQAFTGPATDEEIRVALEYAATSHKYRRELNGDLLRLIFDTARAHKRKGTKLPMLVAEIVRATLPYVERKDALKYEAYKGAVMKIFSGRNARKQHALAEWRRSHQESAEPAPSPAPEAHPEDLRKKYRRQLKLL